jgi:Phosphotransferase enzyme family
MSVKARSILHLPVPKVLSFNSDVSNPVGTEYILMEEAAGIQLSETWDSMDLEEQVKITEKLVDINSKFLSASFTLAGGLYHKNSIPDAAPAAFLGDFPDTLKDEVRQRFVIGPSVERLFWEKVREHMTIDRGPCEFALPWLKFDTHAPLGKNAAEYLAAIARCETSWIREFAKPKTGGMVKLSAAQRSPLAHIDLLEKFLQIIPLILPQQNDLLRPVLWHRDLHKGNIFVKDGKISSIIDWQATWIGPMLLWARTPLLVDHKGDIMLRLPENFKQLPKEAQPIIEDQVRKSILVYLYETDTRKRNPELHAVLQYPHGRTINQLVEFAGITWDGDILPFRESLIRLER